MGLGTVRRLAAGAVVAAGLTFYPVVTPVWASPRPVPPKVSDTAISGVDGGALASTPAAKDPKAVRAEKDPNRASQPSGALPRAGESDRPAVLTPELPRERFSVAGVSWTARGEADPVVQVRVREPGGWSDWTTLDAVHGPDAGSPEAERKGARVATEPIFSPSADAVQVRVDTADPAALEGLTLKTVDPGTSPADGNLTGTGASAHAAVSRPGIITRAQWGADESLRDCSPTYSSTIKAGFVHHTAGTNSYAPSDSAALVRGIYAYHVSGNGWCDVGYNFLVDRYGQIFEGRAGGIDYPVVGAHTGGFNTDTFAVSAMGTFTSAAPPAAMLNSIGAVLGWKLGMYGRNIGGTDVLVSAGGSATRHPAGAAVSLNVVSGHRDPGLTDCPGATLYAQLPNLRAIATSYRNANYRPDFATAFQANTGNLWTTGTVGTEDRRLGMMPETSPSLALAPGSVGHQSAFQANNGRLWTVGTLGARDFGLGMMRGTSPSITLVGGGTGYQIAFQANSGRLWTVGALGTRDLGLGMMPGTSPSITAVGGGYQIAFQANTGQLWTTGTSGTRDLRLGMASGTSPSITAVNGGYQIAFQANTSSVWATGAQGTRNFGLGMASGTSPSVTAVSGGGGYQVAFQANTTSLWTTGALGASDRGLGMMPGTSPSIDSVDGGYQIAFQANTSSLWTTGALGTFDLRLGMSRRTSPDS